MSSPALPHDAATVVLLRDGAASASGALEALMVRRKKGAAFMADAFVFPGGRVDDEDDVGHPVVGSDAIDPRTIAEAGGDRAHAVTLAIAAIRELFEEAGVLLAVDGRGALVSDNLTPEIVDGRRAVHDGTRGLRELAAELDLWLPVDALTFFARWITPETEARRFDARFYLARMPPGQTAAHAEAELCEHRWATPQQLLSDPSVSLPPPTRWHLDDLARHATVEQALAWARARPVATVRPKLVAIDGAPAIVLPWDPEYPSFPGENFVIAGDHPTAGPITRFLLIDGRWVGRAG